MTAAANGVTFRVGDAVVGTVVRAAPINTKCRSVERTLQPGARERLQECCARATEADLALLRRSQAAAAVSATAS
jgi:hypothetical protein